MPSSERLRRRRSASSDYRSRSPQRDRRSGRRDFSDRFEPRKHDIYRSNSSRDRRSGEYERNARAGEEHASSPAPSGASRDLKTPTKSTRENSNVNGTHHSNLASNGLFDPVEFAQKLTKTLGEFAGGITDVCILRFQEDSLQRTLTQRNAEYEKSKRHFAEFAAAGKAQKATLQKTKDDIETVRRELKQKSSNVLDKTIQGIVEQMIPYHQGLVESNDGEYEGLKDRVKSLEERPIGNVQSQSNPNLEELASLSSKYEDGMLRIREELDTMRKSLAVLQTKVDEQHKAAKDTVAIKTKIENLISKVDKFSDNLLHISKAHEELRAHSQRLDLRVTSMESQREDHSGNNHKTTERNNSPGMAGYRVAKERTPIESGSDLAVSINNLEERVSAIESRSSATYREGLVSSSAFSDLQDKVTVIEKLQDDVGSLLDQFENRVRAVTGVSTAVERELAELQQKELKNREAIGEAQLKLLHQGSSNTPHQAEIQEIQNAIEGLKIGHANLDIRMNNISTDGLARHIVGHIEQIYPHLKNVDRDLQLVSMLSKSHKATANEIQRLGSRLDLLEQPKAQNPTADEESIQGRLDVLSFRAEATDANLNKSKDQFVERISDLDLRLGERVDGVNLRLDVEVNAIRSKMTESLSKLAGPIQDVEELKSQVLRLYELPNNMKPQPNEALKRNNFTRPVSEALLIKSNGNKRLKRGFIEDGYEDVDDSRKD